MTVFAEQTSIKRIDDGRYSAMVDGSWWIIAGPNGGYVAAIVLRAIVAEVADPNRRPRSITLQYLRPPVEGEVQVEVTIERAGRSVTNVTARLTQEGRTLVLAMASLGVDREAPTSFDESPGLPLMPDGSRVPAVSEVPAVEVDPSRDIPMRQHYDLRWVLGHRPFSGDLPVDATARSGGWIRPAEDEPIDEVVLAAMSDAWMPPIFSRIAEPLAVPTIDLTIHFRGLPTDPLDYCFALFDSPLARDGYLVEHGRIYSSDGRLLIESRQLAVVA
ncbi:MAG: thioesterase family protein [Microthrixaceae bacterium]